MFRKPKFMPHFHVEIVEPDTVYLMSEEDHFVLIGRIYALLSPLLNGKNTLESIVKLLRAEVSLFAIYHTLTLLKNKGYIVDDYELSDEKVAFWSLQGVDPKIAIERLRNTRVSLRTLGGVESETFVSILSSFYIETREESEDLTVVLTDDYLRSDLKEFNYKALRAHKPWILIKPVGINICIGPIFVPNRTGCWQCLAYRLKGNREVETAVGQQKELNMVFPTSKSALRSHMQIGLNLAASEIAKWAVHRRNEHLEGKVATLDLISLSMQHHVLTKRPQCPSCGQMRGLEIYKPKPILLNSQKKLFTIDGGHRVLTPEQTFHRYSHHISPITGVVSTLSKIEAESDLINVYSANHSSGGKVDSLERLESSLRHKSAGKGKTDQQAKTSALCEAIERYSGIFTGDEQRIRKTYNQLKSDAIHPNSCLKFSTQQYENREEWNKHHGRFAWVPDPFNEELEVDWTAVWSLTQQTFKYLPTAYCYYNYPLSEGHKFCQADSNGCAAGNTLEEAVLQGLFEVVERDSVALWWYNRLRKSGVDLDSFNEPYLASLKDCYQAIMQRDFWVLDITSDLGIPSFVSISCKTDTKSEILLGFGTHFDPRIAILRAVSEMNQSLGIEFKNGESKLDEPDWEYWLKEATIQNQPYLIPSATTAQKVFTDYQDRRNEDIRQDILDCIEIIAQHEMEVLVLDQTCIDIGMSVVKVIVPEMRHFWNRFAPGRLYDVPVKLGWLQMPLKEEELNPIPMFF